MRSRWLGFSGVFLFPFSFCRDAWVVGEEEEVERRGKGEGGDGILGEISFLVCIWRLLLGS